MHTKICAQIEKTMKYLRTSLMYGYEIHLKYNTKRYGGCALYYLGAKMFNELPTKLTNLKNFKQFNIQLRVFYIDKYKFIRLHALSMIDIVV